VLRRRLALRESRKKHRQQRRAQKRSEDRFGIGQITGASEKLLLDKFQNDKSVHNGGKECDQALS